MYVIKNPARSKCYLAFDEDNKPLWVSKATEAEMYYSESDATGVIEQSLDCEAIVERLAKDTLVNHHTVAMTVYIGVPTGTGIPDNEVFLAAKRFLDRTLEKGTDLMFRVEEDYIAETHQDVVS